MNEQPPRVTRRRALHLVLAGAFVAAGTSAIAIVGSFLKPRVPQGFGVPVYAGRAQDYPRGGEPIPHPDGDFWLANLDPSDRKPNGTGGGVGLLACWIECPHMGATVPWRPNFEYEGVKGWYRCPSHGATFTRAGVRVFGPAPRSLDTMRITISGDGRVTVHTGEITRGDVAPGGLDNPKRAVDHPLLPT